MFSIQPSCYRVHGCSFASGLDHAERWRCSQRSETVHSSIPPRSLEPFMGLLLHVDTLPRLKAQKLIKHDHCPLGIRNTGFVFLQWPEVITSQGRSFYFCNVYKVFFLLLLFFLTVNTSLILCNLTYLLVPFRLTRVM